MSTRDIQNHVRALSGISISPELFSYPVLDEVSAWQSRPLVPTCAIVLFEAAQFKIRNEGLVSNNAAYLAIGIRASAYKECSASGSCRARGPSSVYP